MIYIKKYSSKDKIDWDNFIRSSKNGTFLFYRDYMDYHKQRFIDHSLIIYKKGQIIGVFPANENGSDINSHGGLTFGGLIMPMSLKAQDVLDVFKSIINYYKELGFDRILYKTIPCIFHTYPAEEDLYALFRFKAQLYRRDISSIIALNKPIKFSESKRQAVTKCLKNDVQFGESYCFAGYWDLLIKVLEKFNVKPVHSLTEIEYLKNAFPQNIRLFEAKKNNELLAGIVIYEFGEVIHTQYMANSDNGRSIGALDYINYKLINEVYASKRYFSFGISTTHNGNVLNEGLIQQKEMMGGRAIVLDFYQIDLTI